MKEKIVIDTDPWVDDALAIMYAVKRGCNIIALTTVFWNNTLKNCSKNALKILTILWVNIPVFVWNRISRSSVLQIALSHWIDWFWWFETVINQKFEEKTALDYYINLLENNTDIVIICIWPLTNISELSICRPDLINNIKEIIILWWVVWEKWNITNYAEFNVYNDPISFKQVIWLNVNKYLIPINVCRKIIFALSDFDKINDLSISDSLKKITSWYIDYYKTDSIYWNFTWWVMYDLLAIFFYTNRELFEYRSAFIDINLNKWEKYWETLELNNYIYNNCWLITNVDNIKLKNIFFNILNN